MLNMKYIGEKVIITCKYENGKTGELWFESIDEESGRPYYYIKLDHEQNPEIFFQGEFEKVVTA